MIASNYIRVENLREGMVVWQVHPGFSFKKIVKITEISPNGLKGIWFQTEEDYLNNRAWITDAYNPTHGYLHYRIYDPSPKDKSGFSKFLKDHNL